VKVLVEEGLGVQVEVFVSDGMNDGINEGVQLGVKEIVGDIEDVGLGVYE